MICGSEEAAAWLACEGLSAAFVGGFVAGGLCVLLCGCEPVDLECESDPGCALEGESDSDDGEEWSAPESADALEGDAIEDVPGCAVIRGLTMNPSRAEKNRRRWVSVDTSKCGPNPAPRLVRWEVGNGLEIETWAESVDGCAVAVDEVYADLIFEDEMAITVWANGGSDDSLVTAAALHDGEQFVTPGDGRTWFRVTDDLFVPMLYVGPTCDPPPWL